MNRSSIPLLLILLIAACSLRSDEPSVSLVSDSKTTRLSPVDRSALRSGAEAILASCNNNSEAHQEFIPWPPDLREEWSRRTAADHLLVRYPEAQVFETVGGTFEVEALLLPLPPGQIPAQPLTRTEHAVVGYSKCSGTLIIEVSCTPQITPLMPTSYREYCEEYRKAASPPRDG